MLAFRRFLVVVTIASFYGMELTALLVWCRLWRLPHSRDDLVGRFLARCCEKLGGVFVKAAQLLGTRHDLFPAATIVALERLQDRMVPINPEVIIEVVRKSLGVEIADIFQRFDLRPVSSASIAQVHVAELRPSGRRVAVKVRKPSVAAQMPCDLALLEICGWVLSRIAPLRRIPVREVLEQVSLAIREQIDFRKEATYHLRFSEMFQLDEQVAIPRLHLCLCTDEVLVSDFHDDLRRIDDSSIDSDEHKRLMRIALRALYQMIFVAGLVHCDLHPGNLMCDSEGRVVILDMGFAAALSADDREQFQEFFLCMTLNRGEYAAKILVNTALRVPSNFDLPNFELEVSEVIRENSRLTAGQFQVGVFVATLFSLQRKYALYGTPNFTLAILSLLVFEGVAKHRYPELDFQGEAMPVFLSMARASAETRSGRNV
jgi:ubiquinone biosynthesis protein